MNVFNNKIINKTFLFFQTAVVLVKRNIIVITQLANFHDYYVIPVNSWKNRVTLTICVIIIITIIVCLRQWNRLNKLCFPMICFSLYQSHESSFFYLSFRYNFNCRAFGFIMQNIIENLSIHFPFPLQDDHRRYWTKTI